MDEEPRESSATPPPQFTNLEDANVRLFELNAEVERLLGVIDRAAYERKRAADQVAHLFRVSAAVLAEPDLGEQLRLVAGGIVTACNFRRCVMTLFDDDWQVWKRAHAGLSEEEGQALEQTPAISAEIRRSILDERYRIGNSFFIPHDSSLGTELSGVGVSTTRKEEDFIDWHPEDFLFVPLAGKDEKMLGLISVDDPFDGRRPTPESLTMLELFAREAAFAIEQNLLLSELSKTEGYLDNLVTNSADCIVATNTEGNISLWNDGASRILGYEKWEILGQSVLRLYRSREEAQEIRRLLMSPEGGEGRLAGHETALVAKDGEHIPVALSVSALYGPEGEFLGTAGISRDLRPWKRLEREMLEAEKAATVGEVAATLCHEINNFLEEILSAGQVSLLTLDLEDVRRMYDDAGKTATLSKEVERLKVISREALKIASLTNRLQAMARGGQYETSEYVGDIRMAELPQKGEPLGDGKILVADDREYIREFLKDFLVLEGFDVDVARDGQEAIDKAKEHHYDLVLSDIKMPHKNGYEVFEGVRACDPSTKVILMTAYGYDPSHSIVKASGEGLSDVLYKPFHMSRVRSAIFKALSTNGGGEGN